MFVRLLTSLSGVDFNHQHGAIVEFDDEQAQRFIDRGMAEPAFAEGGLVSAAVPYVVGDQGFAIDASLISDPQVESALREAGAVSIDVTTDAPSDREGLSSAEDLDQVAAEIAAKEHTSTVDPAPESKPKSRAPRVPRKAAKAK